MASLYHASALLVVVIHLTSWTGTTAQQFPGWANHTNCLTKTSDGDAIELIQSVPMPITVYIAAQPDPISIEEWVELPDSAGPYAKNGDGRNTTFIDSCIYRSPSAPTNCASDACFVQTEILNHTWLELATIECSNGQQAFPESDPNCASWDTTQQPPPVGCLGWNINSQCKQLLFSSEIWRLEDPWGNHYVLHAHAGDYINATTEVLPEGWSVEFVELDEDVIITPIGEQECYLNVLRDANNNGYHQYTFGDVNLFTGSTYCPDLMEV